MLVHQALDARFVEEVPERLIGDCAYNSDLLDAELAAQNVQMNSPHRKKPKAQDGRVLHRYKRQ